MPCPPLQTQPQIITISLPQRGGILPLKRKKKIKENIFPPLSTFLPAKRAPSSGTSNPNLPNTPGLSSYFVSLGFQATPGAISSPQLDIRASVPVSGYEEWMRTKKITSSAEHQLSAKRTSLAAERKPLRSRLDSCEPSHLGSKRFEALPLLFSRSSSVAALFSRTIEKWGPI